MKEYLEKRILDLKNEYKFIEKERLHCNVRFMKERYVVDLVVIDIQIKELENCREAHRNDDGIIES